ncbi:C2 domain-containing protein [Fennellomyces sp. T-0311]|nr:C2 domain-containing protein [Fennellomyces sp. T-0311]
MSYQQTYSSQEFSYEEQTTTYQRVGNQAPTYQVQQSSYHSQQQSSALTLTVHSATNLKNVETLGKQDPYLRFSYDFSDSKSWQQTFVAKDAGKNATWNQTFQLPPPGAAPDLFIEVMDEEKGADELIGFAAIPLRQIAQGQALSAAFQIYTVKSEAAGEVQLTFSTHPQQQGGYPQGTGQSYVHEGHLKRCKSMRNKGIAADVATVAVGGALAVGAGLLGKKLYDDKKKQEQEEAEEEERRRQEQEKFEQEKARLEAEKKKFQQEQQQQQQQHHQKKDHCEPKHGHGQSHGHCEPKKKSHCDADTWNPVGTYAAGDRVEYHGRTYVCLQGHTSNPTWMPTAAHSLWQAE